jgi:5-formyltetrahydrofolate cyclo-ligase
MSVTLDEEKRRLRSEARRRRAAAAAAARGAGEALRERVSATLALPEGAVVSAYWPMGSEIDPRALMESLHERGHPMALPVVPGSDRPLVFRAWRPGDALQPAAFNTNEPGPDKPELTPRVLLVPLLAFDRTGYRLGYGGGFYDRTLAALRAVGPVLAVGLAYAGQEMDSVPRDAHDRRLDWIVTETETIRIG